MKTALAALAALALAVTLAGCSSVTGSDLAAPALAPAVSLQVERLDLETETLRTVETPLGPVTYPERGEVVVTARIQPPGLRVTIEQSPDCKNWIQPDPLRVLVVEAGELYEVRQWTFAPLINLQGDSFARQFFRAHY